MSKALTISERPFVRSQSFRGHVLTKEPIYVVPDATLSIRQLASRFVRGDMTNINVHNAQYSTKLEPIMRRGIDLCDYSEIKQHYDNEAAAFENNTYETAIKEIIEVNKKLKDKEPPKE